MPYNPDLLLKYNAHISVECCSSLKLLNAIKYIYKYIFKGYDCADVLITTENRHNAEPEPVYQHDEINNFLSGRYVSPPEACWRIFEFNTHGRSHTVQHLPVHLPEQQTVVFDETNGSNIQERVSISTSKLLEWFKLNERDEAARALLYTEIPLHYVWKSNAWAMRQRNVEASVVRMYHVSPQQGDKYFLRLLLLHIRGAQSFEHLRTHEGVVYDTFREEPQ